MYQSNLTKNYFSRLLIWEMPAFLIIILPRISKQGNIEHLKSSLDNPITIIQIYGHWLALCSKWWPTTSCSSLKRFREFPRMKITCTKLLKFLVLFPKSMLWVELKVQDTSTKKEDFWTDCQKLRFPYTNYFMKISIIHCRMR